MRNVEKWKVMVLGYQPIKKTIVLSTMIIERCYVSCCKVAGNDGEKG